LNAKKMTDPPKKKHANRPRAIPANPWTEAERAERLVYEYQKAIWHLAEADKILPLRAAPNACVHSAYYAMYHCACAAILAAGGVGKLKNFPESHQHVLAHYETLTAIETGALGGTAAALSRVLGLRELGDYGVNRNPSVADSETAVREAHEFIAACCEKWNFAV
jgi:uncharacterized protein (UPF0332 family)